MHKPLFVVSVRDLSEGRYIPDEEDVWNEVKSRCDYIGLAEEDEWTEKNFVKALESMFGLENVTISDGKYYIAKKAVRAHLEKLAEKVREHASKTINAETLCKWKNQLWYGILEDSYQFIVDGSFDFETDFCTTLMNHEPEKGYVAVKFEAVYDTHF